MNRNEIVEQVTKIYKDYDGYFHNVYDFSYATPYHESQIFRHEDELYLVLSNILSEEPNHNLTSYCKIPKTYNELNKLMKELGYIKDNRKQMDLNTLKLVYEYLEDRLEFLDKNRPKSKSIVGMELACQFVFDLIASNGEGVKK
jgi:hypothetical protein